jgi:hypothetical protein
MSYKLQVTSYKKRAYRLSQILFIFLPFLLFSFSPFSLFAQSEPMEEPVKTEMEIVKDKVEDNASEIKKLKKFKVSGYVQAQFEVGQEYAATKIGAVTRFDNTRDGGKYEFDNDKGYGVSKTDNFFRFGIRRGRIKFTWEESFGSAVFQLDITEKGVNFKDAYFKVSDPWIKVFSLTAGIFDRPFGDEIGYSSSRRESPERSILHQELFPDERDLGAMITIAGPKGSAVDGLKLEAGAFCGNGIAIPDNGKMDFIGHLKYDKKWSNISFGVGASMYLGHVRNRTDREWRIGDVERVIDGETVTLQGWTSDSVTMFGKLPRQYGGFDAQFSAQSSWGISNIRAEVVWGTQTSSSSRIRSPRGDFMQYSNDFNYVRKFWGAHVYFVQDIYKTPLSIVLKYAHMTPNTEISKEEVKAKVELPYDYIGFGLLVRCTSYLRLMCYYDLPFNSTKNGFAKPNIKDAEGYDPAKPETIPGAGYNNILDYTNHVKEGVFTCRLQFKF